MAWKIFFSLVFIIIAVSLLVLYWFMPFGISEFEARKIGSSNFTINGFEKDMQFYENMRYPSSKISYKIENCPLQKEDEVERAFEILSIQTILSFYSVNSNEEISVTCDSGTKINGGLFIAGEGGPINITQTEKFNVIFNGKILLIRKSNCENPNIALHELLHALGFTHSSNPNNIMYNVSKCSQTIGQDTLDLINKLYSYPSYPDLSFENVSAVMHGRYLDMNIGIRNNGLKKSEKATISIYADKELVKEIELEPLDIGYGREIFLKNVWISKISVSELELSIDYSLNELEKENNKITLKIKNKD